MRTVHNKLIRDRVPEIIAAEGGVSEVETLDEDRFCEALRHKLVEEAYEAEVAEGEAFLDELADVYEVLHTLALVEGFGEQALADRIEQRRRERGAFDKRIFLHWVDEPDA